MSISTRSCCSIASCSSGSGMATQSTPLKQKSPGSPANTRADVRQGSEAVRRGWESELKGRILQFPRQTTDFIDELLPCNVPFPDVGKDEEKELDAMFHEYKPEKGKELHEYKHLLEGLNALVATFSPEKKLTITDTHGTKFYFPFDAFKDNHHYTYPDITVSFPGKAINPEAKWQDVSMVMEVKADETDDPFAGSSEKHIRTLEQLSKNARSLLLAYGFLSAFVVGIYGRTVRLARFDHSCALVAAPISLAAGQGGVKLLKKFLWHFANPVVGGTVVGCDPTVSKFDLDDQEWVKTQLRAVRAKNWERHIGDLDKGRRVEVYDQKTGACVPYLLYHLVDVNGRLFSRATMVWRAIEDTRVLENGRLVPDPTSTKEIKPRILKESWRQFVRTAETEFYERLDMMLEDRRFGIATMRCGGDIGVFESRWKEETKRRNSGDVPPGDDVALPSTTESPVQHQPYLPFFSTGSGHVKMFAPPAPDSDHLPEDDYPLPHTQHQTLSWRLVGDDCWHRERSHMRMVIDDVGRPLTEFTSTRELVLAMRDAIRGHRQAWEEARVLHRDVSLGNIVILDEHDGDDHVGFMHDFDYSSMEPLEENEGAAQEITSNDKGPDVMPLKERTGTYFFMALDLIKPLSATLHYPRHDLESYYWVLLWVVLRHTECVRRGMKVSGKQACAEIFKCEDASAGYAFKYMWVSTERWMDFKDNAPLTALVTKFSELVFRQIGTFWSRSNDVVLTHSNVLEAFDQALEMEGWPENDWIPCNLDDDFDPRSVKEPILSVMPPDYPGVQSEGRVHRSHPESLSLSDTAIQAGLAASLGHLPTVTRLPTPFHSGSHGSSGLKRSHGETDQVPLPMPSEASRAPKRSKSTMDPPPHPNAAIAESSSSTSALRSRGRGGSGVRQEPKRSSERIAARKKASGSGPSGTT